MYEYREKKIVAVIEKDIESWMAMNIVGHLCIAMGATLGRDVMGRLELCDASGERHTGIAKYPLVILRAKRTKLTEAIAVAKATMGVFVADYPRQMLETGHDDELADAIAAVHADQMEYLGALFYGPCEAVSMLTGKFSVWK